MALETSPDHLPLSRINPKEGNYNQMLIETEAKTYRWNDLSEITGLHKVSLYNNLRHDTEVFKPHQRVGSCFLLTDTEIEELRRVGILVRNYRMQFLPAVRMVRDGWSPPQNENGIDDGKAP